MAVGDRDNNSNFTFEMIWIQTMSFLNDKLAHALNEIVSYTN